MSVKPWVWRSALDWLIRELDDDRIAQMSVDVEQRLDDQQDVLQGLMLQRCYLLQVAQFFRDGGLWQHQGEDGGTQEDPQDELVNIALECVGGMINGAATKIQARVRCFLVMRRNGAMMRRAAITRTITTTTTGTTHHQSLTLCILGDLSFGDLMGGRGLYSCVDVSYAWEHVFGKTFKDVDLCVSNLTTPFVREEDLQQNRRQKPESAYFVNFYIPPSVGAEILHAGRVHCVNMGNNHALDFGDAGVRTTISTLEEAGIQSCGLVGLPRFVRFPEKRTAMLSIFFEDEDRVEEFVSSRMQRYVSPRSWREFIPLFGRELAEEDLPKEYQCLVICVYMNVGIGFVYEEPSEAHRFFARALIDTVRSKCPWLCPVVWGCGPHFFGAVEMHKDSVILYGTGDFSGPYPSVFSRTDLSFIYHIKMLGNRIEAVILFPCKIRGQRSHALQPGDDDFEEALRIFKARCAPFAKRISIKEGGDGSFVVITAAAAAAAAPSWSSSPLPVAIPFSNPWQEFPLPLEVVSLIFSFLELVDLARFALASRMTSSWVRSGAVNWKARALDYVGPHLLSSEESFESLLCRAVQYQGPLFLRTSNGPISVSSNRRRVFINRRLGGGGSHLVYLQPTTAATQLEVSFVVDHLKGSPRGLGFGITAHAPTDDEPQRRDFVLGDSHSGGLYASGEYGFRGRFEHAIRPFGVGECVRVCYSWVRNTLGFQVGTREALQELYFGIPPRIYLAVIHVNTDCIEEATITINPFTQVM